MKRAKPGDALTSIRAICMAFPATEERLSHGSPTFFAGGKKTFVMFMDDHHGDGRLAIWFAAPPGVQRTLVDDGFREVATKRLIAEHDAARPDR